MDDWNSIENRRRFNVNVKFELVEAYIKDIAYYLPKKIVTNEEIVNDFPEWSVEKITDKVGVRKRHIAAENETATDMAIQAAETLFSQYIVSKKDIDELKDFLTLDADQWRPVYSRDQVTAIRHCLFIMTTNNSAFLTELLGVMYDELPFPKKRKTKIGKGEQV